MFQLTAEWLANLKSLRELERLELYRTLLKPNDFATLTKTFSGDVVGRGTYERVTNFYSFQMRNAERETIPDK